MTVGSLFSGIGGFDLGFERAGFDITWQVEIDDYANRVLAKHWPHVARYRDVRECGAANLAPVDVICGGFPCQPHSLAGRRLASADERDLWGEFARIIREIRPRWVVAENVSGLLSSEAGRFSLAEFSETWPRAGMTRNGIAYPRQPLAPDTPESACGLLPTLTARDHKSDKCSPEYRAKRDAMTMGKTLPWVIGGLLAPEWCERFMGYPSGWTELEHSATPSSRRLPSGSRAASSNRKKGASHESLS